MFTGKYVFAQITSFLSINVFNKYVSKYQGNYKVLHFTCWHQLMCMMLGQLSNCDSLTDLAEAFFVTRAKENMNYRKVYSAKVNKTKGVKCDQTIMLKNYKSAKEYPEKIRRIKYYNKGTENEFDFITNNFRLSALNIALIYKYRWSI